MRVRKLASVAHTRTTKSCRISQGGIVLSAAFFASDDLPLVRKTRIQQNNDDIS